MENRRHPRTKAAVVVGIATSARNERVGLTCDVSEGGVAFRSPSRFGLGEQLKLTFRSPLAMNETIEVTGTVVRTESQSDQFLMRHFTGVSFGPEFAPLPTEDVVAFAS